MTGGRGLKVLATGTTQRQRKTAARTSAGLKRTLAIALGAVALAGTPDITGAADCPAETQVRVPQAPAPPLNIDKVKEALLAYQAKDYDGDVAAVFAAARPYVERRGGEVSKPALVLDIDETSLSNWANIKANNFGFIRDGERQATLWNLDRAGYEGWAKLVTRPDEDSHATVQAFKTEERRKIAQAGYTIIASIGDQQSDLDGGFAECKFKVPNPFYFIP